MDRKLALQRPRQTVSAVIIGGPNIEETILWSLRSYAGLMDQVVIGDTGMIPEVRQMLIDYGVKVIPADNPTIHGFETPRNQALAHAEMDWIFWIDTDEKLLDGQKIGKYLRHNIWNGYGVKQHHFAVDTQFSPDMPVRLFRRESVHGRARWFGMIHEHPEIELNKGPGPVIVLGDVNIAHVGYLIESGRQARFWRNKPMLDADILKYPDRLLQKHFICRDNMLLAGYILSMNGGRVDSTIRDLCEQTISIYRAHFLGRPQAVNVDSIIHYSEALQILGQGVDVRFDIAAGKDSQIAPLSGQVVRYANTDDLIADVTAKAKESIGPFMADHW
jgi:hypothetical protein